MPKPRVVDKTDDKTGTFDSPHRIDSRFRNSIVLLNTDSGRFPVLTACHPHGWQVVAGGGLQNYDAVKAHFAPSTPESMPFDALIARIADFEPFKVSGYTEWPYFGAPWPTTVFVSRIPARTYSYGYSQNNMGITTLDGERMGWQSTDALNALSKMYDNQYPAFSTVRSQADRASAPLSRNIAVRLYDEDLGRWQVFFRTHLIGFLFAEPHRAVRFKPLPSVRNVSLYREELKTLLI